MIKKSHSRGGFSVSRDTGTTDAPDKQPDWFKEFSNNIAKSAVKSKEEDQNIFEQINSILNNKSKYSSVAEAVLDMQRRTGLLDIMNNKTASENMDLFKKIPHLKTFIDNYVEARPGTSVDSVVFEILKMNNITSLLPKSDEVPEEVRKYINGKIGEVAMNNPDKNNAKDNMNLGKVDLTVDENDTSNDFFGSCEPNKKV